METEVQCRSVGREGEGRGAPSGRRRAFYWDFTAQSVELILLTRRINL